MYFDAFTVRLLHIVLLGDLIVVDGHGELPRLDLDEVRRMLIHFSRKQSFIFSEVLHAKCGRHDDQAQRVR